MNTFDRHVIRRFVTGYVFFVGALILFFVVLHYVEYMDDFFDRGATLSEVFLVYYPSYVPKIVRLTSPLALFLACIYLTGKLAQELQIAALQTSGVSLYRLMRPYVVVAVLTTSFMFWFNGWIVPVTNATVLKFDQKYLKDAPQRVDISDIHRQNAPRSIVTVGYYDDDARTGHRVSLQRFENA
ncbi:MAG: YjgP/YjgQ family permease, partial [Bacteroidetes bacterium QS_8_64_10]